MRRFIYILFASLAMIAGCNLIDEPGMVLGNTPEGEKVTVSFQVAIPTDSEETKAMGNTPAIDPDGFYVAVFGGSGYFNEWVKATVQSATANYDTTSSTIYTLSASFTVSDSRLRLHFIANCPVSVRTSPPISGSSDNEENVLSKIRSQLSESYNDGYWQKIILPNGIRAEKNNQGVWIPTTATTNQFPNPIVLVRNFARVYLRNLTPIYNGQQEVVIKKFALAYAPSEGVIAPILSAPYSSNVVGVPIPEVSDEDNTTRVYYESFFMNYQRYSIDSNNASDTLLTSAPFNYEGYSPSDQSYNYYVGNTDVQIPADADMKTWNSSDLTQNVLFVYERTIPNASRRATRVIIKAERFDCTDPNNPVSEGDKYYALDIVNTEGVSIPLLRNQTYTVHLLSIEAGTGETDINKASKASSATVSGDPTYQNLINISDGKSSIGTSFTEQFYVQPQTDSLMFRYIPTNITDDNYTANQEGNELVTIKVGSYNANTGAFTELTTSEAASQNILTFKTEGNNYKVWIVKENNVAVPFVRSNNRWVKATTEINDPNIEKWGMIKYELSESYKDEDDYFTQERSMAIHVTGIYDNREMSRNVVIKTSPRQDLIVNCQQKYVAEKAGEQEVLRIKIPTGLSRSVFPLEFTIEADAYSLTPNGDVMPVAYGTSTIENHDGPAYYFVKTLTQAQYDALGTVTENGKTWKVFDCHFKTTVAQNASTIYVKNRFFKDAQASDLFYNYSQRLFTWSTVPTTIYRNGNTTFTFVMDSAHSSATTVWWDPTNALNQSSSAEQAREKGLSTSNRVLPPIMTVTLNGFTPQYQDDGETPVTTGLVHSSGNTYLYYVGTGTPTSTMATVNLALKATGAIGSSGMVTLSTANLSDNPLLYASLASSAITIQGASFSNLAFSNPSTLPLGLNKTTTFSFQYVDGLIEPITIAMSGLTLNGTDSRMFDNGDGTYTFTPNNTNTSQSISLKSTTRFSSGTVTLSSDNYNEASKTINRETSFTVPKNAVYIRNVSTGNPSNFTTGNSTYVYVNNTSSYDYFTGSYFSNSYLNNSALTMNMNKFTLVNDDAVVYFWYRYYNNGYKYVTATAMLSELVDATTSNPATLHFKEWKTGSITLTVSSSNYNNAEGGFYHESSNITIDFTNTTGVKNGNNYYMQIGSTSAAGTIVLSAANSTLYGCKLTSATITYRRNDRTVSASIGSMSSDKKTWTASSTATGAGDTSVTITMAAGSTPNQISQIVINYGYYE
ncbi:MAG: hypothetical protein IK009_00315 [Bacteroidales bacterium]|nr:hypothetical protein [Bacteroidales bacterium]